ncbi:oligosaccharide flippase family protein [Mycolicibacterium elephantis]
MTKQRNAGGGTPRRSPSLLVFGRLGSSALMLISAPIVARALGPDGRGETAAALALFLIVPVVLGVGLPLEVRRQAARSDGHAVIRTARRIIALSTVFAALLAMLTYFTIFSDFNATGRAVATVGVALAPLSTSWAIDVSVLVAHRRYRGILLIQLMQPTVYVTFIVFFWALGVASVATVLLASLAGTAATFMAGLLLVRVPIQGPRVCTKSLLRNGITYFGSAIAEMASARADQVLALPLIGAYQAGLYSVAATIGSVPLSVGHALGATYFAPIANAHDRRRIQLQGEAIRAAIAAALMGVPLLALTAWLTIPTIFGREFVPSIHPTMIVLIGSAAMLVAYVASMTLAAEGRGASMTIAQIAALVCAIASLFILGPPLGAVGAAFASTLGYVVLLALLLLSLRIPARLLVPSPKDFVKSIKRLIRD